MVQDWKHSFHATKCHALFPLKKMLFSSACNIYNSVSSHLPRDLPQLPVASNIKADILQSLIRFQSIQRNNRISAVDKYFVRSKKIYIQDIKLNRKFLRILVLGSKDQESIWGSECSGGNIKMWMNLGIVGNYNSSVTYWKVYYTLERMWGFDCPCKLVEDDSIYRTAIRRLQVGYIEPQKIGEQYDLNLLKNVCILLESSNKKETNYGIDSTRHRTNILEKNYLSERNLP